MAEIAEWQRKNYKKVQSFADGGMVLTEEERQMQEGAREMSTIKGVDLKKGKDKKTIVQAPTIAAGNLQMNPDRWTPGEAPQGSDDKYQRMLEERVRAAVGYRDGGYVKGKL